LFCVLLIVVLSRVGATILDFVTMGAEETKLFYAPLFNDRTFSEAVLQVLVGMTALLLTAALGYWRGTHQRFATYLNYLLKNVPEATRHVIVELAVDEARRAGAEQVPIAERVLPAGSRPQFAK
jgi:hypothetical protein